MSFLIEYQKAWFSPLLNCFTESYCNVGLQHAVNSALDQVTNHGFVNLHVQGHLGVNDYCKCINSQSIVYCLGYHAQGRLLSCIHMLNPRSYLLLPVRPVNKKSSYFPKTANNKSLHNESSIMGVNCLCNTC